MFYGDAAKCFGGKASEKENLILDRKYWENKDLNENLISEVLVDGDIEVVEILKEISSDDHVSKK